MRISDWSSDVCSSDLGGFALTGGNLAPVLEALPHEMLIIGGAAVGSPIIGNSGKDLKALGGGIVKVFRGPTYKKSEYLDCILLVSTLMKMMRTEGPVAVDPHIEDPASSPTFRWEEHTSELQTRMRIS